MTTKFGVGIVFRKAQLSAKFHCPASTVTVFSKVGEVIESQKWSTSSGGAIIYNCPCYVRRRG